MSELIVRNILGAVALVGAASHVAGQVATFTGHNFDLPGGTVASTVTAVSGDGRVVVGRSRTDLGEAGFHWSAADGLTGLGSVRATDVNFDGSVVLGWGWTWSPGVGVARIVGYFDGEICTSTCPATSGIAISRDGAVLAVRIGSTVSAWWSEGTGFVLLADYRPTNYPLTPPPYAQVFGMSGDGGTAVGAAMSDLEQMVVTRWGPNGVAEALRDLHGGALLGAAYAASLDGSVIVGSSAGMGGEEAFRWTAAGGRVGLGDLDGGAFFSRAAAVSGDGRIVVGHATDESGPQAFIWDERRGLRSMRAALAAEYGLDTGGWTLSFAADVSDDGLTIVGNGTDPSGQPRSWIVQLPPLLACAANVDGNHRIDVFDLLGYLDLWFATDAAAERTGDDPAMIDVHDLLVFLTDWFAGCTP